MNSSEDEHKEDEFDDDNDQNLNELTNVELYEELVPIIKQLCNNFFYKDISI